METQQALDRLYAIVLAAVDYDFESRIAKVKNNGIDPQMMFLERQKGKAKRFYQQNSDKSLRKLLTETTLRARLSGDTKYNAYIKERTGYDVDLFADARAAVKAILQKQEISGEEEWYDVLSIMQLHHDAGENAAYDQLEVLSAAYKKKPRPGFIETSDPFGKRYETIHSPDGNCFVSIFESILDKNKPTTQMQVNCPERGGAGICTFEGIDLALKVTWKDDHHLLVERQPGIAVNTAWTELTIAGRVIAIEYTETANL